MYKHRLYYSLGVVVSILLASAPALAQTTPDAASNNAAMPPEPTSASSADSHPSPASKPIVVSERMHLNASPDNVWATVRDFASPGLWIPGIKNTHMLKGQNNQPGARRQIIRQDDRALVEQLLDWDGPHKRLTYRMVHGWLPVNHYTSTLAVQSDGDSGSYVVWEARFKPGGGQTADSSRQAVHQYYVTALENLRHMLSAGESDETQAPDNQAP